MRNNLYSIGEPFNLEVEITDDSMCKTVEDMILRSITKGTELLPGLKINKSYKQTPDKKDALSSKMKDEFNKLMKLTQESFNNFFNKWNNTEQSEVNDKTNQETSHSSDYSFNGWPSVTNCIRNCKKCFARCLYRKEENPEQSGKRKIVTPEDIPATIKAIKEKQKYDGGWVDMENKSAVETMFNSVQI